MQNYLNIERTQYNLDFYRYLMIICICFNTYCEVQGSTPTVSLSSTVNGATNTIDQDLVIFFSEPVTGFEISDLDLFNATASLRFEKDTQEFYVNVSALKEGTVMVSLGPGKVSDNEGNLNLASNILRYRFDQSIPRAEFGPVPTITAESEISIPLTFNEEVQGLEPEDLSSTNGRVVEVSGGGEEYFITVESISPGMVTLHLPEMSLVDLAGNGNASESISWEFDDTIPMLYSVKIDEPAINSLNQNDISFMIDSREVGTSYEFVFSSSDGSGSLGGTGMIRSYSTTIEGNDLSILEDGPITLEVSAIHENGLRSEIVRDQLIKNTRRDIPQGFSPNGDGLEDVWMIPGIENYPDNVVTIFNRYGKKVFQQEAYDGRDKVWTGVANTTGALGTGALPDGTYFYVIEFALSDIPAKSGYVILNR